MHQPVGPAFLVYLETSGLATLMRQSQWLYPIVEIAHILGFVTLVGSVAMFDLRLLGLSPQPARFGAWRGISCAGRWRACCSSCRPAS